MRLSRALARSVGGILSLVLIAVAGCPPMTSPDGNGNSANGNGNSSGSGGGVLDGAELSPAARSSVISAVEEFLPTLSPEDVEGSRTALVAMLKAKSDIVDAGANDDGSVWAIFSDGLPLLVALNNPVPDPDPATLLSRDAVRSPSSAGVGTLRSMGITGHADKVRSRTQADGAAANKSVPDSKSVYLFNGFGDSPEVRSHLNNLSGWFSDHGYQDATPTRDATIEALQQVKDAGVFYINGHGGIGYLRLRFGDRVSNEPIFGLGTLSERARDGSTDARYRDLLRDQQLGFLIVPRTLFGVPLRFGPTAWSRYFVTAQFVARNWTFSPGSWVYLDVCHGDDRFFKDACREVGGGLFFSWDLTVRNSDTLETAQYLFSRTLGVNEFFSGARVVAESPPQRAFNLSAVLIDMASRRRRNPAALPGIANTLLESSSLNNTPTRPTAELLFENLQGVQEAILVPTIRSMGVDDREGRLSMIGSFGAERGTVSVGGQDASVSDWNPFAVTCSVPAGAAGPVVVTVKERSSHPRQLTRWAGTITSTLSGPMNTTDTCTLRVEFRGDVQSSRAVPGDQPRYEKNSSFRCIPANSRVESASESGVLSCGPNRTGQATVTTDAGDLSALPYIDGLDSGDGYFFQPDLSTGNSINAETGETRTSVAFGVRKANAVVYDVNCPPSLPTTRRELLDPSGGLLIIMRPGNYDVSEDIAVTEGGLTLSVTARFTAQHPPSSSDPR
ncbi:MAG: hypothetical protein SF069_01090 [Phycisphaerae bacterium]|nr:hypothetical protein [Phycisphaerae bacterium]